MFGSLQLQVTLTVQLVRGGGSRDVTLTRQPIQYQPVASELCGSGSGSGGADSSKPLGYIRVSTFSKQTPDALRDAIRALKVLHALYLCRRVENPLPHPPLDCLLSTAEQNVMQLLTDVLASRSSPRQLAS